jgi:hypothetical protein
MSEIKHTPGPWAVSPVFISQPAEPALHFGEYQIELSLMNPEPARRGINLTLPREIAEANARLIAAAPELLEALEHMVSVSNWATTIQSEEQYDAMIANAEAAIRKAKGE